MYRDDAISGYWIRWWCWSPSGNRELFMSGLCLIFRGRHCHDSNPWEHLYLVRIHPHYARLSCQLIINIDCDKNWDTQLWVFCVESDDINLSMSRLRFYCVKWCFSSENNHSMHIISNANININIENIYWMSLDWMFLSLIFLFSLSFSVIF